MYNPNKFLRVSQIKLSEKTIELLEKAEKIYWENFDGKTWYGRCIFLSWYCSNATCSFCFRSTDKHKHMHAEDSRRSLASVLLEALFCKIFNWRIEFLTGGYDIIPYDELVEVMKTVSDVYGEKIWLNLGVLNDERLEKCRPYVKGICASMETLNPNLHEKVCPKKPIKPYDEMFSKLKGFKKSAAIIVGLGEQLEDIQYLFDFVEKHELDRITVYALKPVAGTPFTEGPEPDDNLSWIASLRIRFPKLEIIAGTNLRRAEEVGYLMKAGANAITKFPATKQFGTRKAKFVEELIKAEKRDFVSNLSVLPNIDWDGEIDKLPIKNELKEEMKKKLVLYLKKFQNPKDIDKNL